MPAAEILATAEFELVQVARDRDSGSTAIVALHDTRLGPAFGGIRRHAYASIADGLGDVLALAMAMTWKCALAGLPAGGGKAVILDRPGLDRTAAYRLVGRTVAGLGGRFHTGPDVGTTAADLAIVALETPNVAVPDDLGHGDLAQSTAVGVVAAIQAVAQRLGRPIDGLCVAVQGLGAVGSRLCRLLHAAGARLIVADLDAALAERTASACAATAVPPAALLTVDCDVLAPCALGGVLDLAAVPQLRALAVCGAANNIVADAAAGRLLHQRGILFVPDFVANAGGLIHGATQHLEGHAPAPERLQRIGAVAGEILDRSRRDDVPAGELAVALARQRVEAGARRR
jgi:leucine dehydrogenase